MTGEVHSAGPGTHRVPDKYHEARSLDRPLEKRPGIHFPITISAHYP